MADLVTKSFLFSVTYCQVYGFQGVASIYLLLTLVGEELHTLDAVGSLQFSLAAC